jgi:hypothetical protein
MQTEGGPQHIPEFVFRIGGVDKKFVPMYEYIKLKKELGQYQNEITELRGMLRKMTESRDQVNRKLIFAIDAIQSGDTRNALILLRGRNT